MYPMNKWATSGIPVLIGGEQSPAWIYNCILLVWDIPVTAVEPDSGYTDVSG